MSIEKPPDPVLFLSVLGNLPRKSNSRQLIFNQKTGKPASIKSKAALQYVADFKKQIHKKHRLGISYPVALFAYIYYRNPMSDLSDEILSDCLEEEGILLNDNLIREKHLVWRFDPLKPRVELYLVRLDSYPQEWVPNYTNKGEKKCPAKAKKTPRSQSPRQKMKSILEKKGLI